MKEFIKEAIKHVHGGLLTLNEIPLEMRAAVQAGVAVYNPPKDSPRKIEKKAPAKKESTKKK